MTKKPILPDEGIQLPEWDNPADAMPVETIWQIVVRAWADTSNVETVALRLEAELAREGIMTVEQLAVAPIKLIANAARAALQADAQALQAAANKMLQGGS